MNLDRAAVGPERVRKFHKKAVPDCLDLPPAVAMERTTRNPPVFFEQDESKGFVLLSRGGISHDIGEHHPCEPPLCLGQMISLSSPSVQEIKPFGTCSHPPACPPA